MHIYFNLKIITQIAKNPKFSNIIANAEVLAITLELVRLLCCNTYQYIIIINSHIFFLFSMPDFFSRCIEKYIFMEYSVHVGFDPGYILFYTGVNTRLFSSSTPGPPDINSIDYCRVIRRAFTDNQRSTCNFKSVL